MKNVPIDPYPSDDFQKKADDLLQGGFRLERGGFSLDNSTSWKDPWINNSFSPVFITVASAPEQRKKLTARSQKNLEGKGLGWDYAYGLFWDLWEAVRIRDIYFSSQTSVKTDSISFGIKYNSPEKAAYYIEDLLSGCAYVSEEFDTASVDAESVVVRMFKSADEYIAETSFDEIVANLPKLDAPLSPLYPVILAPEGSGNESSGKELFDIFSNVVVWALPMCRGSSFGNGKKEDKDKQFIRQRYKKEQLAEFGYPEIRVNGHINQITLIPKGCEIMDEEAKELNINHLSGGHLQVDLSKIEFVEKNDGVETYQYVDKYRNGISVEVSDPWWNLGGKKVYSVIISPNVLLTEAGVSELVPLDIDLTPIGLGDYKNAFRASPVPKVDILDPGTAIYSSCYYNGDYLDEFSEYFRLNVQAGITMAEAMFDERGIVQKVVLLKMDGGFIKPHIKNTVFLNAFGEYDWDTAFHETVHLVHHRYDLQKLPAIERIVERYMEGNVPPAFCKMINEGACGYCNGENIKNLNRWLDPSEFIAVLSSSIMADEPSEKFANLTAKEQKRYIEELEVLLTAIAENIPNGKELPMYRRIINTLYLLK